MMQNYIDILRQLNYELVKELGLFKHRAGLSFSQRHILYHIKNNISPVSYTHLTLPTIA